TDLTAEKSAPRPFGETRHIEQIVVSPDGRRVAAGGGTSRRVTTLEAASGADLLPRPGHAGMIGGVVVTRDGTAVTVSGFDRTVCWWDAEHGRERRRLRIDGRVAMIFPS